MSTRSNEIQWVSDSLDDLAVILREVHGMDDIALLVDHVREELDRRTGLRSEEPTISFVVGTKDRLDRGPDGVFRMLKTALIAISLAVATPCFAQQVRVISGDIQHVYGPGAQLLDDPDLQARNERAWEHSLAEKQLVIQERQVEVEMRQVEVEKERLKLQSASPREWLRIG